jgi:hypothetical protein
MVGEMVAILRWELDELQPHDAEHPPVAEFEKMRQQDRVKAMRKAGLIDPMIEQWFEQLRTRRNSHLHYFSKTPPDAPGDALVCYRIACGLVSWVIGNRPDAPDAQLNPALLEWLSRKGFTTDKPASDSPLASPGTR